MLALFVLIGSLMVDTEDARPLSAPTLRPPSADYPFGTDRQGRDLFAVMVAGTPLTLRIGFIAMINGWWWWWTAPTVIILTVFLGLFFLTVGLDEIANPRLRRSV